MNVTSALTVKDIYRFEWYEEQGGDRPWLFKAVDVTGETVFCAYSISYAELEVLKNIFGITNVHTFTTYSAYV